MNQEEITRRLKSALSSRQYPPALEWPESVRGAPPSQLFTMPVLVWVPECREANWKCPVRNCACTPQVRGYKSREVDDVEHRTLLLFCRYRCRTTAKMFSTLSASYMDAQSAEVAIQFPYIMTHKFGISKKLMMVIHGGVTSRLGTKSALDGVLAQRHSRFFRLRSLFGEAVRQRRDENPSYIAPMPPTLEQYTAVHRLSDQDTLTQLWLSWSEIYSALSEMVMNATEVKKLVRIDHSRKFTSLLKNCGSGGKKEGVSNFHLLLLVQNECGQIVERALTSSENSTETDKVLTEKILPRVNSHPERQYFLISDNATAVRGSVDQVFGGRVHTKQDPFHVIQRFTEKVRRGIERNRVAKELSACLYHGNRALRDAAAMGEQLQVVADTVHTKDLLCTREEWERTVASNLRQIERGDMAVDNNFYTENGRTSKVVSTSQLEGVHSQLKKALSHPVSIGVGLRVLDIFILEHNIRVGSRWGRNPTVGQTDFLQLCQSALLCSGSVPESPLYAFALDVLSQPVVEPRYRLTSAVDFPFRRWLGIFNTARPSPERLQLQARARPKYEIRELMFRSSTRVKSNDVSRSRLLECLNILDGHMEVNGPLSPEELELLKQVRREMMAFQSKGLNSLEPALDWSACHVSTTVLYNLAVSANENPSLSLSRRGYMALTKSIGPVNELLESKPSVGKNKLPLFSFATPRLVDDDHTAHEHAVQLDLFKVLKETRGIRHRKQVFARVYTMAACTSEYLRAKSFSVLYTRWSTLNTAARRQLQRQNETEDEEKESYISEQLFERPAISANPCGGVVPELVPAIVLNQPHDGLVVQAPRPPEPLEEMPTSQTLAPVHEPVTPAMDSRAPPQVAMDFHATPQVAMPRASPPPSQYTVIREHDLVMLSNEAAAIGRVPGKWVHMHRRLTELYPTSTLSLNALRCRIKQFQSKSARSDPLKPPPVPLNQGSSVPVASSKKRATSTTACAACASRHKKCGRAGDTACTVATKKTKTNAGLIDHFLV